MSLMIDNKKKIAAMTAVLYYLQAENEAFTILPESKTMPSAPEGFWTYSGRQSQMMLRSMAQMRLFPGWRG
jgi:hypothetical protein